MLVKRTTSNKEQILIFVVDNGLLRGRLQKTLASQQRIALRTRRTFLRARQTSLRAQLQVGFLSALGGHTSYDTTGAISTTAISFASTVTLFQFDTSPTTSMATTATASLLQTSSASQIAVETSEANATKNKASDNGLSQGAKVGLGIGFGLGGPLLVLLLVSLLFFRRRKRQLRIKMDPKYTPQAQSELSMVENLYPMPAGPPRPGQPQDFTARLSQAYSGPPPPPFRVSVEEPVSAVTQKDTHDCIHRRSLHQSLTLQIPEPEEDSLRPREVSPTRGGSPVSPVSPASMIVPNVSRSLSSRS